MPVVKNEQTIKQDSLYPKYEVGDSGNELLLRSHLYKIDFHFLNNVKKSVLCHGDECVYCIAGNRSRTEYNYAVRLNGKPGFMDIKSSVFFAIQGIAKAQKKDPRAISWTVIKTGQGLDTEYTTSKNDNLSEEELLTDEQVEKNTKKLEEAMDKREAIFEENYNTFEKDFTKPTPKEEVIEDAEIVSPEDIPF